MYTQNPPIEMMAEIAAEHLGGARDDYEAALLRSLDRDDGEVEITVYGDGVVSHRVSLGGSYLVHEDEPVATLRLAARWECTEDDVDDDDWLRDVLEWWETSIKTALVEAERHAETEMHLSMV